jgi:hypothetical protein
LSIPAVGTYTYRVIACQNTYTPSNVVGGTWIVQNAVTSPIRVILDGTQTFSGQGSIQ